MKRLGKCSSFVIYSCLKDKAFSAVKVKQSSKLRRYVKGVPLILSVEGIQKGYLFCQKFKTDKW